MLDNNYILNILGKIFQLLDRLHYRGLSYTIFLHLGFEFLFLYMYISDAAGSIKTEPK